MNNYKRQPGDDLLSNDPRLKYFWRWIRGGSGISRETLKTWTHFQISFCEIEDWRLESVQWSRGHELGSWYQSCVSYGGESIVRSEERHETRLDAQIGAEALLEKWIRTEYERIVQKPGVTN